ncbi:uncharacterized protein LOC144428257 isoform X1 [Styela clava]
MVAAVSEIRLPSTLDLHNENLSETFKKWKRQIDIFMLASGSTSKSKEEQKAIILYCAGAQMIEAAEHFVYSDTEDENDPKVILQKMAEHCNPRKNEVMETFRFFNIQYKDNFESFLVELRSKADSCNFENKDRMIRDKIVFSVSGKLQEILLRETDLNMSKAIKICQTYEMSEKQATEIRATSESEQRILSTKNRQYRNTNRAPKNKRIPNAYQECKFCGRRHKFGISFCPAYGKTCHSCNGRNHFRVKCRNASYVRQMKKHDQNEETLEEGHQRVQNINNVNSSRITALMEVNNYEVRFQIDSAADVNTICEKYVRKDQIRPTTDNLVMWNKTKMKPLGEAILKVKNPRNDEVAEMG